MRFTGHKYRAQRTECEGISFASKAEAGRYAELRLLEKAGEITELERQPAFELHVGRERLGLYRADFRYKQRVVGLAYAQTVIEDVKGFEVPLQKWKRKHAEAQYSMTVQVIKDRRKTAAKRGKGKR